MKELGQELSKLKHRPTGSLRERIGSARRFYEGLGVVMEGEEQRDKLIIKGYGCLLAEVVKTDPNICIAVESMLSELIVAVVKRRCHFDARPTCHFEVARSRKISKKE